MAKDEEQEKRYNEEYDKRNVLSKGETYEGPARPGRPMEVEELEPSPPEFQAATQSARSDESGPKAEPHPTEELDSTPSHKATKGKASHMTDELSVKPRGRRR